MRCVFLLLTFLKASLVFAKDASTSEDVTPHWLNVFTTRFGSCGLPDKCDDISNFRDRSGRSCRYYEDNPRLCNDRENDDNESPDDACCACGGGKINFRECTDFRRFEDRSGRTCSFYDRNPRDCNNSENRDGDSPNDACCACDGGDRPSNDPVCDDFRNYEDRDGYTCSHYENKPSDCSETFENDDGVSPCEACCICGGGQSSEPTNGSGQFEGLFYIESSSTGEFLNFSVRRGASFSPDRVLIQIISYRDNYALQQYIPSQISSVDPSYLTIDDPTGLAFVEATTRLTSSEEFEIADVNSLGTSGAITFQHVESGRYLRARTNGDVSVSRTVSFTEHFLLREYNSPASAFEFQATE